MEIIEVVHIEMDDDGNVLSERRCRDPFSRLLFWARMKWAEFSDAPVCIKIVDED